MVAKSIPCVVDNVHHVGIAVRDIENTLVIYENLFGIKPGPILENVDYAVRGCFISVGSTNLELVQATSSSSTVAKFIETRGEGLHHICFEVSDLAKRIDQLKAAGVRLVDQQPRKGLAGGMVAFLHPSATQGVLIELGQHA